MPISPKTEMRKEEENDIIILPDFGSFFFFLSPFNTHLNTYYIVITILYTWSIQQLTRKMVLSPGTIQQQLQETDIIHNFT